MQMRPINPMAPWMVFCLLSCTDKVGSDTGSSADDSADDGTIYTAQEGDWTLAPATIEQDECGLGSQLASGDAQPLTVAASSAGLVLTFEGMDGWSCTQSGNSLACEDQVTEESDYSGNGLDAVISGGLGLSGKLSSNTRMSLNLSAFFICEGEDCDAVVEAEGLDVPCTTILSSVATVD
jgi:hypothetical protein